MESKDLLQEWLFRTRRSQLAHYECATYFARLNFYLGIPVIVLSTVVGTSIFATLQKETNTSVRIAVGIASVMAAVLAAIQTFLRYSERAEKHRVIGAKYGAMRREIEQKIVFPPAEIEQYIESLRVRWDKFNEDCPTTPKRIWERIDTSIKSRITRPA